jgi:hypothetical protein
MQKNQKKIHLFHFQNEAKNKTKYFKTKGFILYDTWLRLTSHTILESG